MSRWTLDNETARILKQDDFWDSANLINGSYRRVSLLGAGGYLVKRHQDKKQASKYPRS